MRRCGKCGKEGHNARSCTTAGKEKSSPAPERVLTVSEILSGRREVLRRELGIIERVLEELGS